MAVEGERAERCETCRFWLFFASKDQPQPDDGICRRYPPALPVVNELPMALYPHLPADGWCGEWSGKSDNQRRATDALALIEEMDADVIAEQREILYRQYNALGTLLRSARAREKGQKRKRS